MSGSALKVYVLDANAVVRFLTEDADWDRVRQLFVKVLRNEVRLAMCVINWGEVIYTLAKKVGTEQAVADLKLLERSVEVVPADQALTIEAAVLRHHYKLGYADCFAAALALRLQATLVTADLEFERIHKLKRMALIRHNERS